MTTASPNIGRFILAYDELLLRPDLAELIPQIRDALKASGYTWLLDQGDAAARQVHDGMSEVTATTDNRAAYLAPEQHPDWVRLGLLTALITWCAGRSATCTHSPQPMSPEPVAAAAWKPNLVVCGACSHLLSIPRRSAKDRTCDGCGTVTKGLEHGDPIWPFTVTYGGFLYLVGVCATCRYWEEDAATRRDTVHRPQTEGR